MIALGVIVAIIEGDRVLLTKREDFEVWCLPGGIVEEETGLEVELTSLVGVYSRLGGGLPDVHAVLYTAKPLGGELQMQAGETVELAFFSSADLPKEMLFGTQQRVNDA